MESLLDHITNTKTLVSLLEDSAASKDRPAMLLELQDIVGEIREILLLIQREAPERQ